MNADGWECLAAFPSSQHPSFPEDGEASPEQAERNQVEVFAMEDARGVRLSRPQDGLAGCQFRLDGFEGCLVDWWHFRES